MRKYNTPTLSADLNFIKKKYKPTDTDDVYMKIFAPKYYKKDIVNSISQIAIYTEEKAEKLNKVIEENEKNIASSLNPSENKRKLESEEINVTKTSTPKKKSKTKKTPKDSEILFDKHVSNVIETIQNDNEKLKKNATPKKQETFAVPLSKQHPVLSNFARDQMNYWSASEIDSMHPEIKRFFERNASELTPIELKEKLVEYLCNDKLLLCIIERVETKLKQKRK